MIRTIYPYFKGQGWVFDDERQALKEEPFVLGISEMITALVLSCKIPDSEHGFELSFSDLPIADSVELSWQRSEEILPGGLDEHGGLPLAGDWYAGEVGGQRMEGWLCPALLHYFPEPPEKIYVIAGRLPPHISPIWDVQHDDPRSRRFINPE